MSTISFEAREYIAKAREALQRGDKESARQLGKRAARTAPEMEDAWLVLIASEPHPQKAIAYARQALKINPKSVRARRGLEWALSRVKQTQTRDVLPEQNAALNLSVDQKSAVASLPQRVYQRKTPTNQLKINSRNRFYLALSIGVGCLMVGLVGLFVLTSPALASITSNVSSLVSTQENLWASVDIAKPTITPIDVSALAPAKADSTVPTSAPMDLAALNATDAPANTPEATETPGTVAMEIVADDSMSQSVSSAEEDTQYPAEGNGDRWIDVNLSEQRVYAYEGNVVVNSFLVSTGVAETPTVTGEYQIYVKVRIQDMSGPGYYLPDVPWVMYFYDEYGFHGTYWHNNFGTPMSRGCVNMRIDDAAWLYEWASVGTRVNVHY
jgi:lipoprotein-anchoring transpeptidase ErfK/SrfK